MQPLVTVITPSFNQGKYIRATIESVLEQDYPQIEYIVIDGGSTDSTVNVLKSCHDPRLVWISEPDRGQTDALNKGLRRARGAYLTYLNSDDLLLPRAISTSVDAFERDATIDLIYGDCQFIDTEGAPILTARAAPFDLTHIVTGKLAILQPGTVWRRRVFEKLGFFWDELHYCMDIDYWIRAGAADCRFSYLPGARSAFRLHQTSKSVSQAPLFWNEWLRILDRQYGRDDLPETLVAVKVAAYAYVAWNTVKAQWSAKQYVQVRPALKQFALHGSSGRRIAAASMLLDSYLPTALTPRLYGLAQRFQDSTMLRQTLSALKGRRK